jgi:Holliday junction resolvasome RuvABC endonuclease subunit
MTSANTNSKRVLAVDPTSRGFGFVVLESPATLVEWGNKVIRQQHEATILTKVSKLIRHYLPDIIVFEDCKGSRRGARVQSLLDGIGRLATAEGLESHRFPVAQVKKVFRAFHATTKHEIAHAVAHQLPDLASWLPRFRKPWMSEGYQMAIFDAAALALTYFNSRLLRSGGSRRAKPESMAGALKNHQDWHE